MAERIVVLVGGRSTEHDASLHSFWGFLADLESRSSAPIEIAAVWYVDRNGIGHRHSRDPWPATLEDLASTPPSSRIELLSELVEWDGFVLSLLHGNEGEDGAWQGVAEVLDLRGSFGPVLPSALAMDKWAQAIVAVAISAGELRAPRTWRVRSPSRSRLEKITAELQGGACVVKPNRMGASLLTTLHEAANADDLEAAISSIAQYDEALVQERIVGREYTVGVVSRDGTALALPVIEAITANAFLSHDEKHRADGATASLLDDADPVSVGLRRLSLRLFDEIGFRTMCRFDYIVGEDGQVWFLEANAMPGLMPGSVFPTMLRTAGMDLVDLVLAAIDDERRQPRRDKVLPYAIERDATQSPISGAR